MRLVVYSDSLTRGGAEQTLGTVLAHLDRSYEVTVVGVEPAVVEFIADRRPGAARQVVPPISNKSDMRAIGSLMRTIRRLRPDIVHVNLATPWRGSYAQLAGIATRGTKVVAMEHSLLPSVSRLQVVAKRALSKRIAAHVACGRWLADEIARHIAVPADHIEVIHNGITTDRPEPTPDRPTGFVIGSVGRLSVEKGFDVLIRAVAAVPDVRLVLVGEGPEHARLEALARELGIADRVLLTGWVEDARSWLVTYDILALPSYAEGFPLTSLEAMFAGVPVVATDVGGVHEAVRDGDTGILVPPGNVERLRSALQRLVDEPALRDSLRANGRALVEEQFTAPVMAARFDALYRRVLGVS